KICFFSPSLNQHIFAAELGYIDKEQKIDFFKCYQQLFEIPMLQDSPRYRSGNGNSLDLLRYYHRNTELLKHGTKINSQILFSVSPSFRDSVIPDRACPRSLSPKAVIGDSLSGNTRE
ncbi:MAG: hypothetical protein AB1349_11135, partial [Elusimicrobiota bacterium]